MIDIIPSTIRLKLLDGILCESYKKPQLNSLDDCRLITLERQRLTEGRLHPLVIDLREVRYISLEVRNYLLSYDARQSCSAIGILADNPFSRLQGNLLMKFHKNVYHIPIRMFSQFDLAIDWLGQYIRQTDYTVL